MIGKTISHYKILEKLGEGGMGVVYKAQDTKLDRIVALKFLPKHLLCDQEAKTRFEQEAKAASALDHPNICTIHEIDEIEGECFISMSYIEGKSLKKLIEEKTLSLKEVIDIAIQVCEGLLVAHETGIIHRDIKSDNIMVTSRGLTKIMDFGLAKLRGVSRVTKTGSTLGTIQYMSPEQAKGMEVDQRSDIFSLGVVLYEMITGQLPFRGDYEAAIMYSILNENPEPLARYKANVPEGLQRIIDRALEKDWEIRYQHIDDFRADLKKLTKEIEFHIKKQQPSIAVLPFTNLSADKEQEYFCDGMAEEIINALTQVEGLRVVARTSAFAFKDKHEDIREIGRKLNVEALLEGSVRKSGKHLRITAQLINVSDGYHLWSERFDRNMEDVFSIQDEISLAIVGELKGRLLGIEKSAVAGRHTKDVEAYDSYMQGRYFWNKRTEAGFQKGLECFQKAIEKDPAYALAYAGIADCYNLLGWYGVLPSKEAFTKAKAAAEMALEIDADLPEALTSLAFAVMSYDWDWEEAERNYKRALELNPRYATAHHWYAEYLVSMGRMDEAMMEAKRALEFDPLSLILIALRVMVLYLSLQYDEAVKQGKRILEMTTSFPAGHLWIGMAYTKKSMFDEAISEFQSAIALFGRSSLMQGALGYAYAASGKQEEAQKLLNELKQISEPTCVPWFHIAAIYVELGENDRAFEWLMRAYKEHDPWLVFLKVDPIWQDLHSDRRYIALLKKMGLEK
jgi:serine/threonine protein kinase/Tfp pilus assembly protein PilF